jgi:excisionase family DNA binding protein
MSLLTAKEVSEILRVPKARVYQLVREYDLPSVRLGDRQVRFDEASLRSWIERGGSTQAAREKQSEQAA